MIENSHLQRVNTVCETFALLDEGAGVNIKGRDGGEMFVIVIVVVVPVLIMSEAYRCA